MGIVIRPLASSSALTSATPAIYMKPQEEGIFRISAVSDTDVGNYYMFILAQQLPSFGSTLCHMIMVVIEWTAFNAMN